ncbi:MAG: hypothetical protein ACI8UD_000664 [Planctomycetota bacterium]|jgi:hypothetical protein
MEQIGDNSSKTIKMMEHCNDDKMRSCHTHFVDRFCANAGSRLIRRLHT